LRWREIRTRGGEVRERRNPGEPRALPGGNTRERRRTRTAEKSPEVGPSLAGRRQEGRNPERRMAAVEENAPKGSASRRANPSPKGNEGRPNAANPRVGSGVQQTRETGDGENRHGGEKPRRRNRICPRQGQAEGTRPKGKPGGFGPGVDVASSCRWRGDLWKPHERRSARAGQGSPKGVFERQTGWNGSRRDQR